jgi:hypothetical protein
MSTFPRHSRFLACHDCGTLVPADIAERTDFNGAAQELALGLQEFVVEHASHSLSELRRTEAESVSNGPLWDPLAPIQIELTDGEQCYVASGRRACIDEARRYEFRLSTLRIVSCQVDIDERDIRRGLDLEFFPHAVRPTKVDEFVDALHNALREVETEDLEIAFVDAQDPAVSIARMPEPTFQRLLAASARIFDPWEMPLVQRFLEENREEDGVLALRVRRQAAAFDE